jgi:hypothetical protein
MPDTDVPPATFRFLGCRPLPPADQRESDNDRIRHRAVISYISADPAAAKVVGWLPVPLGPLVTLVRGYERLSRHPRILAEQLLRLAEDKAFTIDAAIRDLGYAPRPFADGIDDEARALGLKA